jgi:DNA-binding transcriptional regulator YiaG
LSLKELATHLNRPISMVQVYLKDPCVSRQITAKIREDREQQTRVYILKSNPIRSTRLNPIASASELNPNALRERAGLTRHQVAAGLGLSPKTIDSWESFKSQPKLSPYQVQQMLSVYQCTLDELVVAFNGRSSPCEDPADYN